MQGVPSIENSSGSAVLDIVNSYFFYDKIVLYCDEQMQSLLACVTCDITPQEFSSMQPVMHDEPMVKKRQ